MKFNYMVNMLLENREYSCAMLKFKNDEVIAEIMSILSKIPKEFLTKDGLEFDPHVTLLYGIHTTDQDAIIKAIPITKPINVSIIDVSLFENEDFDVVKIDLKSDELVNANKSLKKLDYTSSYNDYHPHCTLAYVNAGKGKEVLQIIEEDVKNLIGKELETEYIYISTPNGDFDKYMKKL